jgi:hypothetical protein
MLRFIRIMAVFGMVFTCLCYVWDVIEHWDIVRDLWKGKSFSGYERALRVLLGETSSRNIAFCLAGITYCLAGGMLERQRKRKLAEARKAAGSHLAIGRRKKHAVTLTHRAAASGALELDTCRSE